jgi:predicted nucleic acid-binding protein
MDARSLLLAVDTNVLLDLASEAEDVIDAFDVIEARIDEPSFLIPPSVLDELAFLADKEGDEVQMLARKGFQKLRQEERFRPILELPSGHALAQRLAATFLTSGLLPREEIHDAMILSESILLDCAVLLTSDDHLRSVDHEQLTFLLRAHRLPVPVIATPKEIVRKFFR